MTGCPHDELDTSYQLTMAPPIMRCKACDEWIVAYDHCVHCGKKGLERRVVSTDPSRVVFGTPGRTSAKIKSRDFCTHCGEDQRGPTYITETTR